MKQFTWDDWKRDRGWWDRFSAATFRGTTFTDLLFTAMRWLEADLRSGAVRQAADAIVAANPAPPPYDSYNINLLLGRWKYNLWMRNPIGNGIRQVIPHLWISGPENGFPANANGRAPIDGVTIELNYPGMFAWAVANPGVFPTGAANDVICQQRMIVYVGKTVIHEVMHNHGANHGARPAGNYNPANAYWRTLPEVAEHAFYDVHAGLFTGTAGLQFFTAGRDPGSFACAGGITAIEERSSRDYTTHVSKLLESGLEGYTTEGWVESFYKSALPTPLIDTEVLYWSYMLSSTSQESLACVASAMAQHGYISGEVAPVLSGEKGETFYTMPTEKQEARTRPQCVAANRAVESILRDQSTVRVVDISVR